VLAESNKKPAAVAGFFAVEAPSVKKIYAAVFWGGVLIVSRW
jgi:hypothetical protein